MLTQFLFNKSLGLLWPHVDATERSTTIGEEVGERWEWQGTVGPLLE